MSWLSKDIRISKLRPRSLAKALLVLALTGVLAASMASCSDSKNPQGGPGGTSATPSAGYEATVLAATGRPKLVDLGSDTCVPCRLMTAELKALAGEYEGSVDVVVVDIYEAPALASQLGIRVIPTQIFLSPDGKILARHEGFLSKEQMVSMFEELGFPLLPKGVTPVTEDTPAGQQDHVTTTGK